MERQSDSEERKIYQKPQVKQIKLMIEEAVLAVCKTVGGNGPNNGCLEATPCVDIVAS
jgi:hypothetical protein